MKTMTGASLAAAIASAFGYGDSAGLLSPEHKRKPQKDYIPAGPKKNTPPTFVGSTDCTRSHLHPCWELDRERRERLTAEGRMPWQQSITNRHLKTA